MNARWIQSTISHDRWFISAGSLPKRDELLVLRARADTEIESPVRQDVGDRRVFGDANRVVERQQHDRRADSNSLGPRSHGGGHHHRRARPLALAEVMLAVPRAGEPELLGEHGIADVVGVDVLQGVCGIGMVADSVDQRVLHNAFLLVSNSASCSSTLTRCRRSRSLSTRKLQVTVPEWTVVGDELITGVSG